MRLIPKGKASSPNLHPWKPRVHKLPFGVLVPKERGGANHCWCLPGTPQIALLDDLALEDRGSLAGDPEALARKAWIRRTRRDHNASLKPQLKKPWGPEAVRRKEARGMSVREGVLVRL